MNLGQYVLHVEDTYTGKTMTVLLSAICNEELQPFYRVETLDGKYATPKRFDEACDAAKADSIYNIFSLYGADFDTFIDRCTKLRASSLKVIEAMNTPETFGIPPKEAEQ